VKPASAKAKGRRLQQAVAKMIADAFPGLEPDDVRSAIMGENGADIKLSPAARRHFPFAVECKAQERLDLRSAFEQASKNAGELTPIVVHKKNRGEILCTLKLSDLLGALCDSQQS